MIRYTRDQEMIAFGVASEHVTYMHGRGWTYARIAKSVGIPVDAKGTGISRMVLIAKIGRIWLSLRHGEDILQEAA